MSYELREQIKGIWSQVHSVTLVRNKGEDAEAETAPAGVHIVILRALFKSALDATAVSLKYVQSLL